MQPYRTQFTRVCSLVAGLVLLPFLLTPSAESGTINRKKLRELGITGKYSGIISGSEEYRVLETSSFTEIPVSNLESRNVSVKARSIVKSPSGDGSYSLYTKITSKGRRVSIRGAYYGIGLNPSIEIDTVRSGTRGMEFKVGMGSQRSGSARYYDRISEYSPTSGALHARWNVRGTLTK